MRPSFPLTEETRNERKKIAIMPLGKTIRLNERERKFIASSFWLHRKYSSISTPSVWKLGQFRNYWFNRYA